MEKSTDKILNLLLEKHSGDLCVAECKTGATWYNPKFQKLDLWVMKKSWTKSWTIGYEIKASRSDFLQDNKWPEYLKYCTDFYLVAPPEVIQPEEVPPDVGLLITSKNVTRLYTKRKSVHRQVEIPDSLFRYILMWRVKIVRDQESQSMKEYWQNWLAERDESKELGYNVSKKVRQLVEQRIDKVELINKHLKADNEQLTDIKELVKELGFIGSYFSTYQAKNKLRAKVKELETGIPDGLSVYLDNVIKNLSLIREKLTLK